MDHHYRLGASGRMEGFDDKYVYGRRPNGIYIPRFRNLGNEKREYLRGFGYQGGASREGWGRNVAELSIGGDFKDALCEPGGWTMGITAFGETLPYHENKVTLDKTKKDKYKGNDGQSKKYKCFDSKCDNIPNITAILRLAGKKVLTY